VIGRRKRGRIAAGVDGAERHERGGEEDETGPGEAFREELSAEAKREGDGVGEPEGDGEEEFGEVDGVEIAEPVNGAADEGGGHEDYAGDEQAQADVVELEDGGEKGEPAAEVFGFQRVVAENEHERGEREEGENAVAEESEGGVEFDPRIAAEDLDAAGGVPGGDGERGDGEDGGEAGREIAEEAETKGDAEDEVEGGGGPGGELKDLEHVAQRAAADGLAAGVEAEEVAEVAKGDDDVDGGVGLPRAAQKRNRAEDQAGQVAGGGDPNPGAIMESGEHRSKVTSVGEGRVGASPRGGRLLGGFERISDGGVGA